MPNSADLNILQDYALVWILLVPGVIILWVRAQFVPGRTQPQFQPILTYLAISLVYHALALPLAGPLLVTSQLDPADEISSTPYFLAWFGYLFGGPVIGGSLLGLNIRKRPFRRLFHFLGLNPVRAIPTAWDWKFGFKAERQWVLATLKDGTRFAGLCGFDSFISDDPAERDIYIERIYDIGNNGEWIDRGDNGLLIAAGEVRTIEFWPYLPQELSHVSE